MSSEPQYIVSRYLQQRVLLPAMILLALLFAVTAALARAYHVREEEQTRRTWRDFQQGLERLRNCTSTGVSSSTSSHASSDLDDLHKQAQELRMRVNLSALGSDPELRKQTMELVSRIEDMTSQICGPPTGIDQALCLLKNQQEGTNP